MKKKHTKKLLPRGVFILREGAKIAWLSKQSKNGWSLGFTTNNRTIWVTGVRFASRKEVARAVRSSVVFIGLK